MTPMSPIPENRIKRDNQLLRFALSIKYGSLIASFEYKWLASSWRRYNKEPNKWRAFDYISFKLNGQYGDSQVALAIRNQEINDTESKIFSLWHFFNGRLRCEQRTFDINCVTSAHTQCLFIQRFLCNGNGETIEVKIKCIVQIVVCPLIVCLCADGD